MAVWGTRTPALPRSGGFGSFASIPSAGVGAELRTFGPKNAPGGSVSTGRGVTGGTPRVSAGAAFSPGKRLRS